MAKQVLFGSEARAKIVEGVVLAAKIAGATLGPKGRNVVIESPYGGPKITKDGVTVVKSLDFSDPYQKIGLGVLKQAAEKANKVGDGTTTASVLARGFVEEGMKAVAAGMNPTDLRRGMEAAAQHVVDVINNKAKKLQTSAEIAQVATISANGDHHIGEKLAEAFDAVGRNGVVTVEEGGKSEGFETEVVQGMHFDRGWLSPYFVTNQEKMVCEYENPYVLMFEKKISGLQQMLPVLEAVAQTGKPLVIIAEDLENEALATLIVNKLRGGLKVVAVKAPGFGDRRKAMLEDIAIFTGGAVISEDLGQKLENVTLADLGRAKKISISKDDTTIIGGAGEQSHIDARIGQIKNEIENTSSDYDREKLEERLAKLAGGVAILRVGGLTEVESKERKDRVEDAYHATKAAIAEGIVPGGGCTLLYAGKGLANLKGKNEDEQAGINLVRRALSATVRLIVENAGGEGSLVVAKLLEGNDDNLIFDAQKSEYIDAFKAGIVDPANVVRTAFQSAISVASLLISTEVAIVDEPKKNEVAAAAPMGMGGGMGGMGGMDF